MSVITQQLEAHTQMYFTCHVYNQSSASMIGMYMYKNPSDTILLIINMLHLMSLCVFFYMSMNSFL